jgi:hypothetical protein
MHRLKGWLGDQCQRLLGDAGYVVYHLDGSLLIPGDEGDEFYAIPSEVPS